MLQAREFYVPEREVTIDESMIPYHGRNKLIQYMPLKSVKYGFKAFLLCEACGATYRIIRELCGCFKGKNNILFMDRYYTRLQIYNDLKKLKIGACGTLRMDRGQFNEDLKAQIESLTNKDRVSLNTMNPFYDIIWFQVTTQRRIS